VLTQLKHHYLFFLISSSFLLDFLPLPVEFHNHSRYSTQPDKFCNTMCSPAQFISVVCLLSGLSTVQPFSVPQQSVFLLSRSVVNRRLLVSLHAISEEPQKTIKAASISDEPPLVVGANIETGNQEGENAVTGSINDRLLAELQQAADKEKFGAKSGMGKKLGFSGRPRKTPEEQEAALREARDLNGVDPVVALLGGLFAFAVAGALWYATNALGSFFVLHPVETDVYFVQRVAAVFRNVSMGLISLASGFFGVTGMGIFMLGVRVAVGVAKGELDPTPIVPKKGDKAEMPNVWELMMNKKPNRRGGRGGDNNENNPFGL
jgi:Protein of unknown function (DUF3082)